jgi:hypothetical protein
MAFQAPPLGHKWRELRKGCEMWINRMTEEIDCSTGRPRVSTAPLSGERDVLWNGSSKLDHTERRIDGMNS